DLERVEVLKGPQGTLFGQNSTGGAINYIAAKPTDTLKAGFDIGYARFNEVTANAFISGPISDTLRVRAAVAQEYMDGWQKSLTRPGDRLGAKRFYNGRLLVDWEPSDRLKFEANASGWIDKSDSLATQFIRFDASVDTTDPRLQFVGDRLRSSPTDLKSIRAADWDPDFDFARDNKFYLLSLRADWEIAESISLTSITAYSRLTTDMPIDTDGTAFSNFRYDAQDGKIKTFTQELRLSGAISRLRWMIGANYQTLKGNEYQNLHTDGTNNATPVGFIQNQSAYINNQHPITKAVFGSGEFNVTDQLTLQGSIRYTDEKRKFNGCLADAGVDPASTPPGYVPLRDAWSILSWALRGFAGSPPVIPPNGCITFNDATLLPELTRRTLHEDNVSWRAGVNWKPNSDAMIYAYAGKGYKAGSFTILPAIFSSQFQPVTQESIMAYEAGFKVALADRRIQLTGAGFYYDYKDKQLVGVYDSGTFGQLPKLINIPKSRIWGAELEATVRPIEDLQFRGGVTYVNSRVQADPKAPNQALDPYANPTTYIGEAFPSTPRWQALGDAEYGFGLSNDIRAFMGGSITYHGASFAAFGEAPEFRLPPYTLIDLRAGVQSADGNWRFQLWGRNVTNKLYVTNVSHLIDAVTRSVGMPATYGATFSYRY
ncbi:MAG TPA: TonB-dependent receptor, partial [Rhizorhapis sp.]|nr:TonB-dependent receptor [Rhizorhapis sp.]